MDTLKEYIDVIQSLDPMPGASFGEGEPMFVSPDVYVYPMDGDFVILLNDDGLPNLQISTMYNDGDAFCSEKDKEYMNEKLRAATWLIRSLEQRQRTLYKVMESIVKYQRPFFEEGVTRLKPLILKDIADDINMHESTVSRITTNKFVATPHGTFELKFFFNSALGMEDGSQVGSESVKALLKKCIAEEDPKNPLSDERLCEILKEHLGGQHCPAYGSEISYRAGHSLLFAPQKPFLKRTGAFPHFPSWRGSTSIFQTRYHNEPGLILSRGRGSNVTWSGADGSAV